MPRGRTGILSNNEEAEATESERLAWMGSSVRIGRIAGIEFGVNWSWLVVFALIVWTLASAIFPSTNPGLSKGTHIAMAIVAAFLFFSSLLLHEFGHALQARREGIEIDGITLWLFGGVARFKGSFKTAGADLWGIGEMNDVSISRHDGNQV